MRAWSIALLALAGLRRTPLRVALTALGVTIGSGALFTMVGFALGLQRQAEAPFEMLGLLNEIAVTPHSPDEKPGAPALDDNALAEIESLPGVAVAYPEIRMAGVKLAYATKSEPAIAVAVPRELSLVGASEDLLIAGGPFTVHGEPEAIIGRALAEALGFTPAGEAVGKVVELEAGGLSLAGKDTFKFEEQRLPITIVGVYDAPHMMPRMADRGVLLPVEIMKQIPGIQLNSALDRLRAGGAAAAAGYAKASVRVEHFSDLATVETAIRKKGFETRTMLESLEGMRKFFVVIDVLLASVGGIALVVAALGIVNTLLMAVLERYQEIGICKALGASDRDMMVMFLTEAGFIGLLGSVGGLALGWTVSWGLEIAINVYARSRGVVDLLEIFSFPPWLLAATVAFSVLVSVVAGVYPAARAARLDPIRALRQV